MRISDWSSDVCSSDLSSCKGHPPSARSTAPGSHRLKYAGLNIQAHPVGDPNAVCLFAIFASFADQQLYAFPVVPASSMMRCQIVLVVGASAAAFELQGGVVDRKTLVERAHQGVEKGVVIEIGRA